ncbi:terminase large subunit [Anaerotruncus rubiinfantis]|uniref:terminase large subunit n=1 Tax=Anaerotruncus rubiinfantis TaxID=1720200 RepID=UPI00082E9F54|nr:terminase TerL endonuclease subunit [Anaerotruncus rubiinfantis]
MIKETRAYQYAKWCGLSGNRKVGKYIKKQAKAWLKIADGKHKKAYVNEQSVGKVLRLLRLMVHPDLQIPMDEGLEDYAHFLIIAVFCTRTRDDNRRFYTTALLEIARKNFKTFNAAVIFILGMLTEPQFSRFFSVAPDYKLSSELRLAVRKIIKVSPALADHFKINRDMITCLLNDIEYTPLAYSNDGMDGRLANIFLADEAGALDSYPVEAMRSSQITIRNKLGIIISTQYPNDNNVMIDEVDIAKKVLDGLLDREDVFSLLYEPDEELTKEWEKNDLVIFQSNPAAVSNAEIFKSIKDLRTMAVLYENKRENFLCKHCNIMYKGLGVEGYIDIQKVKQCARKDKAAWWNGRRVWLGLDLAQTDDNTAVAMLAEEDGTIYAKVWGFLPKDRVELKTKKEQVDYPRLIREGCCFACGEGVIDYGFVERFIVDLPKKYGVEIVGLGFDRYNALSSVQKLEEAGIECLEIKQHSSVLHPATKLLKECVLKKKFTYDENRLLEINFQNARCTEDTNLNKYVNKKKSAGKVDMVVAIINALHPLQVELINGETDFVIQT